MKNLGRRRFEGQCFHQSIRNQTRKHLRYQNSLIVPFFAQFLNIKFCFPFDFFQSVLLEFQFSDPDYTSLFETFSLILLFTYGRVFDWEHYRSWVDRERKLRTLWWLSSTFYFGMRSYFVLVFIAHVLPLDLKVYVPELVCLWPRFVVFQIVNKSIKK